MGSVVSCRRCVYLLKRLRKLEEIQVSGLGKMIGLET